MSNNIGRRVYKRSGKPFKSGFKTATVKGEVRHKQLPGEMAFIFDEDDSYVACSQCLFVDSPMGVESSLISEHCGWDQVDDFSVQFYNAKLRVNMGPFKIGEVVDSLELAAADGEVRIWSAQGECVWVSKAVLTLEDA